jgi:flagellar basal body-associated protein FliL
MCSGTGGGGLVLNSGNFVVILIILLLLLAGSLAALTFMTFRYKKILERQNEKPSVITKLVSVADKCEKKGKLCPI